MLTTVIKTPISTVTDNMNLSGCDVISTDKYLHIFEGLFCLYLQEKINSGILKIKLLQSFQTLLTSRPMTASYPTRLETSASPL
jgi:hypothetical protein